MIRNSRTVESLTVAGMLAGAESGRLAIGDTSGAGLSYGELGRLIDGTHRFLEKKGITPGDTIAIALRNGPETAALFVALVTYCRVAPLNPSYTAPEIAFALADLKARAVVTTEEIPATLAAAIQCGVAVIRLEAANPPRTGAFELRTEMADRTSSFERVTPEPDAIALLLHTSGTTARPKLVPLTQRNLSLSSQGVAAALELTPADRCLSIMPLFHIHGLVAGLLASLSAGAAVCCAPGFQATRFYSWLDSSRATWYTGVPTMHQAILARARHNADVLRRRRLRLVRSSSAPLYPVVWDQLEETFACPVINAYGMTEAAHQIASVPLPGGSQFRNTVGAPTLLEIAVFDSEGALLAPGQTGEVALRGDQIMSGYLQPEGVNENAFRNGWFRTGDEGFLNSTGALTLTGRTKEMINSGGEKVSPYEVEEALLANPAVAQVVVFASPHALLGEEVVAAVVLNEGYSISERELLDGAGRRLARCKLPRRILFLDEIPNGATGKLQRIGLAARLGLAPAQLTTKRASFPLN